jgi:SPP1 gp7 family putative phage head morphogenesis protein
VENQYRRAIERRIDTIARLVEKRLEAYLNRHGEEIDELARQDDQQILVNAIEQEIANVRLAIEGEWTKEQTRELAEKTAAQGSTITSQKIKQEMSTLLGYDPVLASRAVAATIDEFTRENVSLITKLSQQTLQSLEGDLIQAVRSGRRASEFEQVVQDRLGVGRRRAALIARDQIGKLNGEITKARHMELGITHYEWSTSNDERVRPEHVALDGQVFSYANPPDEGNPGMPINCRCTAIPVLRPQS